MELGVETQHEKERVVARPESHIPGGVVWDSKTMWAQLSPARIKSILAVVSRLKLGHAITVKEFHRLLGFSYDQGMPSCPVHMEETLVSVPRPSIGSVMSPKTLLDRLIPYGLVRGHGRPLCERSVVGPAFLMAHKLSGNSEELSPRSQWSPCPNKSRKYVSGLVFKPSGLRPGDWRLLPEVVKSICERFGLVEVDIVRISSDDPLYTVVFSHAVIETILSSRAPSARRLFSLK